MADGTLPGEAAIRADERLKIAAEIRDRASSGGEGQERGDEKGPQP